MPRSKTTTPSKTSASQPAAIAASLIRRYSFPAQSSAPRLERYAKIRYWHLDRSDWTRPSVGAATKDFLNGRKALIFIAAFIHVCNSARDKNRLHFNNCVQRLGRDQDAFAPSLNGGRASTVVDKQIEFPTATVSKIDGLTFADREDTWEMEPQEVSQCCCSLVAAHTVVLKIGSCVGLEREALLRLIQYVSKNDAGPLGCALHHGVAPRVLDRYRSSLLVHLRRTHSRPHLCQVYEVSAAKPGARQPRGRLRGRLRVDLTYPRYRPGMTAISALRPSTASSSHGSRHPSGSPAQNTRLGFDPSAQNPAQVPNVR